MSLIIGLIGEKGSGKGTCIEFLKEIAGTSKTVARIGSSDILGETLVLWDIEKNRRNLQDLAIVMDVHYGKGTLTHAVWKRMSETEADIIIFDGIRWQSDVDMIRSFKHNLLVYITADVEARYERTKKRKEKVGEAFATYEKFLEEEKVGTELDIPRLGATADTKIQNKSSLKNYKEEIQKLFREKINPLL